MTRLLWCTLPCWRTAALFSTNWATLHILFPVHVGSSSEHTSYSEKNVQAILLWLSTDRKRPSTLAAHCGPVYCEVHICFNFQRLGWAPWARNIDRRWKDMSFTLEQWNYFYLRLKKKRTSMRIKKYIMKGSPNNDKALQSRQKLIEIPQECVVGQSAFWCLHCLFFSWLHRGWLS